MTTTKRTDELKPGDLVMTDHGQQRVIKSVREAPEHGVPVVWDVEYVHPVAIPSPHGAWAAAGDEWTLIEPSRLDLAIRRAQELVDEYAYRDPTDEYAEDNFRELLDLFRAAR